MSQKIKYIKINEKAIVPSKSTEMAAGYDLYACMESNQLIIPHSTVVIGTGISIIPPQGSFGVIFPRSGMAVKKGLRLANCTGIIDPDYRGEVKVALHNDWEKARIISPGDRIAQIVFFAGYPDMGFEEVESIEETVRGSSGFGSTGR